MGATKQYDRTELLDRAVELFPTRQIQDLSLHILESTSPREHLVELYGGGRGRGNLLEVGFYGFGIGLVGNSQGEARE